jgi:gliding motility-associated-like protein
MVMKNSLLKLSLLLLSSFIYSNTFAMPGGGGGGCTATGNNVACPGAVDYCTDTPNSNGTGGSDVCATATVMTFGSSCAASISGTTVNATGNTSYPGCYDEAVNIVWFTFVAQGAANEFTVIPGTLTDALIVIDSDPCADNAIETCAVTTGSNTLTTNWGFSVGDQVWVGVASAGGNDGTFTLIVESYTAPATSGNTCAQAILLCDKDPFNVPNTNCYTASGQRPSCFASNPQQDVWFYFTITQAGSLEWMGDPVVNSEYDWALWNISSGCPGTQVSCNYNFAGACGTPFGMGMGTPNAEFNAALNVTAGQVYALQIDNFSRNGHGFDFTWGGTALIGPVAQFTASPTLQCAASMNVSFNNSSIGTPQNWNFGNGNTYTGTNPPNQTYNTPGTYATTVTINSNGCTATATQFVQLFAPVTVTENHTDEVCLNACDGTISLSPTGGNGIFQYTWTPNVSSGPTATGLCPGNYQISVVDGVCGTPFIVNVTIDPGVAPDISGNLTVCVNSTTQLSGTGTPAASNPWTSSNTGVATVNSTGLVTGVSSGSTTITYTDNNGCSRTATVNVTALDNASFTYPSGTFCVTGGNPTPTITGLAGGTFSVPGVTINASTGEIDLGATGVGGPFTVTYTTNGVCPNTATFQLSIVDSPSAEFTYGGPFCQADPQLTESPAFVGAASGGVFSSTDAGLSLNTSSGVVTFATSTPGVYDVTNTIAASGGCAAAVHIAQIEIRLTPTVNDPADQELCAGSPVTAINFSGNSGSTTYNWTNNNTSIGLAAGGSVNIASFTAVNSGATDQVATITVTPSLNGCDGTPQIFTITVKPVPTVNDPADQSLCAGSNTNEVIFSGNIGGTTYNWTNNNTSTGLAASGTGTIPSFVATNTGSVPITSTVNVTPSFNGCAGNTQEFTITVNPLPTLNDIADQELCAGQNTIDVIFAGNSGSTTYSWSNDNTATGLAANGSGNILSFTATNAGTTPEVSFITVTTLLNGCPGESKSFRITVNPVPTVNNPGNQTICFGESTTDIIFSGNIGSADYNWSATGDNIGLAASGTGNIPSFTPSADGTATITVIPTVDGCDGIQQVFTITVNPIPDASFTIPSSICETGGLVDLVPNQSGGTFSGTGVSGTTFNPATAGVGGPYTITYEINVAECLNQSTQQITVTSLDDASFDFDDYCAGSANGPTNIVTAGGTFSFSPAPGDGATINPSTGVITGGVAGTTYTVEYSTSGACANSSTSTVTVLALPTATITGTRSAICEGEELPDLIISFTGEGPWTYNLNGVDNTTSDNPLIFTSPANGGTFTVTTVTDVNCTNSGNSSSTQVVVTTPLASFDSNPNEGAAPLEVFFTNTSNGTSFSWEFGDGNTSTVENPTNTYTALGEYIVTLTITVNGCTATATDTITVIGGSTVDLPNVFSPDGTGGNELFKSISENMALERFQIFNRWGQLMYEGPAWDGTHNGQKVPEGTYYYIYYGEGADGKVYEGADYTGHLTLVRSK